MADIYKNPLDQAEAIHQGLNRIIPDDIKKGFYDLGYNDEDINNQFGYHKKELADPDDPREITDEQVYGYMRDHLHDNGILPKKQGFTPTKETIWNDTKHPLYGIAPSEQNEEFLSSAIDELAKKTQSPAHWKFYGGPQGGGTRLDAIKKLNQYKKAREYIRNGGK